VNPSSKNIELLAPAGDFEKLEIAIHYGADAVYVAGKDFSLRNFSGNFSLDELQRAKKLTHAHNVKLYLACNIYSRNFEQNPLSEFLKKIGEINPDAIIIADPGIFLAAQKYIPDIPVHLSTQANTTNYNAALFWQNLGIKRINMARELTFGEIADIALNSSVEIEAFVHGAMCISYSGRCLLSSFMANRESNRGQCAHPCRWKYAIVEESRPGQFMPMLEDSRGTYILNSRDLCMIEHIPLMISAGITSLKIEGRMKGIHYLATTVRAYREAIDRYKADPAGYVVSEALKRELEIINYRGYSTGFYFNAPEQIAPNLDLRNTERKPVFIGKVIRQSASQDTRIEVRNKIYRNEAIEILRPGSPVIKDEILDIIDSHRQSVALAQPGSMVTLKLEHDYSPNDLIRRTTNLKDERPTSN
jgi:putative protease